MQRKFQFYIVPTPIGNLEDITLRAIEVLKTVDYIACEDTRTTQNLLNRYDIKTKTFAYHKYNEKSKVDEIIGMLNSGKTIALVSDAGTPMICDPGSVLLKELRKNNIEVTSLAGACAVSTFLSQVPRENEEYAFVGFFPKTEQAGKDLIQKYSKTNMVFYDSPNRIVDTLKFIQSQRGQVNVALGRELTKMFEDITVDSIDNVIEKYQDGIKGEIVCMIYASNDDDIDVDTKINKLKNKGFKSKEIATILAELYGLNKNAVYKRVIQ